MIMPAPKSLDDIFDTMNHCATSGCRLGDIEHYHIEKRLKDALRVQPVQALVGFGILATLDNDEPAMRMYFSRAVLYQQDLAYINLNYAISLMKFGYAEEACAVFMEMLQSPLSSAKYVDNIAYAALELDNNELSEQILLLADRLHISSETLHFLSLHMLLSNSPSTDEELELLNNYLTDEKLKKYSSRLTEKEWRHMQNFADKLKIYL